MRPSLTTNVEAYGCFSVFFVLLGLLYWRLDVLKAEEFFIWSFPSYEPPHDKTKKVYVRPAKTQISLGTCPVWSESSLSAWRNLGSLTTHWAQSKDSGHTGWMPRLIWVFAGRTLILLVLSCRGSFCFLFYRQKSYWLCLNKQYWSNFHFSVND